MEPNKPIVTVYTISMDEFSNIFPWFESLSEPKPPKKRGRKPKQLIDTDTIHPIETKTSVENNIEPEEINLYTRQYPAMYVCGIPVVDFAVDIHAGYRIITIPEPP
jgi:hypothetical protein